MRCTLDYQPEPCLLLSFEDKLAENVWFSFYKLVCSVGELSQVWLAISIEGGKLLLVELLLDGHLKSQSYLLEERQLGLLKQLGGVVLLFQGFLYL